MSAVYRLSMSLPAAPLSRFEAESRSMPRATEAERLMVQRVGQGVFRDALMKYWDHRCPLTGITEEALLRASHIVAWSECDSDAHRLDVHNGILLSALWDAAFEKGLVSFADNGTPIASLILNASARIALAFDAAPNLMGLRDAHRANLARHSSGRRCHGAKRANSLQSASAGHVRIVGRVSVSGARPCHQQPAAVSMPPA
jgi:hypothetical protein